MTMKILMTIGIVLGLLLAGIFFLETIRTASAFQIEFPPGGDDELLEVSDESLLHAGGQSMSEQQIDEYIRYLKRKTSRPGKPSREARMFTKNLLQDIAKRTAFAASEQELQRLEMTNKKEDNRIKSFFGGGLGALKKKRNNQKELHAGGCEATVHWMHLNANHFPRYVKSYNCISENCRNGGVCRPKRYPVYVLRMNAEDNISFTEEGCDVHLPEELRCDWKLIKINVTTYCECDADGINSLTYGR